MININHALIAQAKFNVRKTRGIGGININVIRTDILKKIQQIRDFFENIILKTFVKESIIETIPLPDGGFLMHKDSDGIIQRIFTQGRFAAIIPGNSAAEIVITNGLNNFLNIYNFVLVARLILTWFPSRPQAIEGPLSTLCDPYLNLFRGIIPPVANIDFSPILAFIVLNIFTSSAAALPADLNYKTMVTNKCKNNQIDNTSSHHNKKDNKRKY